MLQPAPPAELFCQVPGLFVTGFDADGETPAAAVEASPL